MGRKSREISGQDRAIGARIREARQRLEVSITDLGLAYGGYRQTVQHWEAGKNFPPVSDLRKLCDLLRMDANSLLGLNDMKSLTADEIVAARKRILLMAEAARVEGAARQSVTRRRLQRRSASAG